MNQKNVKDKFIELYRSNPIIIKSPGRINLIGEHTDYNQGFVLPTTIDLNIFLAIQKNNRDRIRIYALNFNESIDIACCNVSHSETHWANYLLGSYIELVNAGFDLHGFDCVLGGNLPIGAGLSSSAAIECGLIAGLNKLFDLQLESIQIAKLAQAAENNFVGVKCGIMDQFAITHAKENTVLKLDCRSLNYTFHNFNLSNYSIVLVNSNVKHSLAQSEYNTRRQECDEGVDILKKYLPEVNSLRDISEKQLNENRQYLSPLIYKRCLYVVRENKRVDLFCEALNTSNWDRVGDLLYETHYGLKDLYEVSCAELDILINEARKINAVLGARMMGGGFGGCTINLVKTNKLESFIQQILKSYKEKTDIIADVFKVEISNGIEFL